MKKLALSILVVGLFFSLGIYFSKYYQYEHYVIEPRSSEVKSYKINLNLAVSRELENLPGIGSKLAEDIINDRRNHGRFNSIEDLKRVKGLGDKKFAAIRQYLTLEI